MAPASMEGLVGALGELYLLSARASEGSGDRKTVVALYASKLREFPGDIAIDAVKHWRGKFWPAFEELRQAIFADNRLRDRRLRIQALEKFLAGDESEKPKGPPPTEAQLREAVEYFQQKEREEDTFWTDERIEKFRERHGAGGELIMKARRDLAERTEEAMHEGVLRGHAPADVETKPARSTWNTLGKAGAEAVKKADNARRA